jgi:preprotein translocase subunit SecG
VHKHVLDTVYLYVVAVTKTHALPNAKSDRDEFAVIVALTRAYCNNDSFLGLFFIGVRDNDAETRRLLRRSASHQHAIARWGHRKLDRCRLFGRRVGLLTFSLFLHSAKTIPKNSLPVNGSLLSTAVVHCLSMTFVGMLPYIQIPVGVLLIIAVLLQQTGASLGGAFGGDNFSATYHTRRGLEKTLFYATIVLGILLAVSSFVALVLH